MDSHSTVLLPNQQAATAMTAPQPNPVQQFMLDKKVQHAGIAAAAVLAVGGVGYAAYQYFHHQNAGNSGGNPLAPQTDAFIKDPTPQAVHVTEDMSFDKAFATARGEVGAGGFFVWHGKTYDTFYDEEWAKMSAETKQTYDHNVAAAHPEMQEYNAPQPVPMPPPVPVPPVNPVVVTPSPVTPIPVNPVVVTPDHPVTPVNPVVVTPSPVTPVNPIVVTPDNPDVPVNPVTPANPATPNNPIAITPSPVIPAPNNDGATPPSPQPTNITHHDMPIGEVIDLDGDGVMDGILVEGHDGNPTILAIDINQDDIVDGVLVDVNNDGIFDNYAIDVNQDGIIDEAGEVPEAMGHYHHQDPIADVDPLHNPDFDPHANVNDWDTSGHQESYGFEDPDMDNHSNTDEWSVDA